MPFCSYAFYRRHDDWDGQSHRYMVITPDRATSDQFYRGIQEQVVFRQGNVEVRPRRLSANMWTWDATADDDLRELVDRLNSGGPSDIVLGNDHFKGLRGKVYLQQCGNYGSVQFPYLQQYDLADNISGATFFIRNKYAPKEFWHMDGGRVVISTKRRSKFRIETPNKEHIKDLVMVDYDQVTLSHVRGGNQKPISVDQDGYLTTGRGSKRAFEFGCFKGAFETVHRKLDEAKDEKAYYPVLSWGESLPEERTGDIWELC